MVSETFDKCNFKSNQFPEYVAIVKGVKVQANSTTFISYAITVLSPYYDLLHVNDSRKLRLINCLNYIRTWKTDRWRDFFQPIISAQRYVLYAYKS